MFNQEYYKAKLSNILGVTETWFDDTGSESSLYQLPQYTAIPQPNVFDRCWTEFDIYYFILYLFKVINDSIFNLMMLI